jgi:hypothetical protein
MALPNGVGDPAREFGGQRFVRHVAAEAPWVAWHGGEARETAVRAATGGRAEARIIRPGASSIITVPPHDGELVVGFLLEGHVQLDHREGFALGPADSFTIPPGEAWSLAEASDDLRLLHVTTRRMAPEERIS